MDEIEIPDNEDAAGDMDLAELNMARKGAYDWAAACSGAARRLRADAAEIDRLTAELDQAKRVAVWAALYVQKIIRRLPDNSHAIQFDGIQFDGTDAELYRVLVEACDGGRDDG